MPLSLSRHPSLVAYITCGDPDLATTRDIALAAIDAGSDVIELGVPFSDPVADGPVIQRASERALRQGTTLSAVLELAREVRSQRRDAGLIIFSYLNPILRFGLKRFCAAAADAGVDGALVTDLPVEEAQEYLTHMRRRDLATVFLAAPTSTGQRLKRIAEVSTGFLYAVSRTGVTGTRQELATDARQLVTRLRRYTKLPIAVGFGISTAEHVQQVAQFADAAVVGSAIVQAIEKSAPLGHAPQAVAELVKELSAFSSQLSAGSSAVPR
ncbi:MAG: tryptophan synthase subunit alpha [Acidobacteriia bacterium]|nr:tryptophan synthase subunit alpha [Terriglobia bacterium]